MTNSPDDKYYLVFEQYAPGVKESEGIHHDGVPQYIGKPGKGLRLTLDEARELAKERSKRKDVRKIRIVDGASWRGKSIEVWEDGEVVTGIIERIRKRVSL